MYRIERGQSTENSRNEKRSTKAKFDLCDLCACMSCMHVMHTLAWHDACGVRYAGASTSFLSLRDDPKNVCTTGLLEMN